MPILRLLTRNCALLAMTLILRPRASVAALHHRTSSTQLNRAHAKGLAQTARKLCYMSNRLRWEYLPEPWRIDFHLRT